MSRHRKPRLLIISAVKPYPRNSGQRVRVYNSILALRSLFEVTFLTVVKPAEMEMAKKELASLVDHVIVFPSISQRHSLARLWHKFWGALYTLVTGLKASNYVIGRVDLSPDPIAAHCPVQEYDLVLYEYWHATDSVDLFCRQRIPCVLDMHNILWQSYDRQLMTHPFPWMRFWRKRLVRAYRRREEAAWARYDALIAISEGEAEDVRAVVPETTILVAPMGVDLSKWSYCWSPAAPPRLAFYGNLGSRPNQASVSRCVRRIMPRIWQRIPGAEFWVVGANPPPEIVNLGRHARIHVTGFVPQVAELLSTMTVVLCPWRGTFGFRSRLIEAMALGVPVVATPDAVYGMGMEVNKGIFLSEDDRELAQYCLALIQRPDWTKEQSLLARQQVEKKFSFESTYSQLAGRLYELACQFDQHPSCRQIPAMAR